MKGATALPCAMISKLPNIASNTMIGSSQYFLRSRMKCHNSTRKESIALPLELVSHGFWCRSGREALDPIASRIGVSTQAEQVLAVKAEEQPHGGHGGIKQQARHDRGHDPLEQTAHFEPQPIEQGQGLRKKEREQQKGPADHKGPPAGVRVVKQWPDAVA